MSVTLVRADRRGVDRYKVAFRNGATEWEISGKDDTKLTVANTNKCLVIAGRLLDPYSGKEIAYSVSRAYEVEIDHVVALGAAWRSGASRWTAAQRAAFANDTSNMLASARAANQEKSSKAPDTWRPRREYWCAYATRWVTAKSRYQLTITPPERDALRRSIPEGRGRSAQPLSRAGRCTSRLVSSVEALERAVHGLGESGSRRGAIRALAALSSNPNRFRSESLPPVIVDRQGPHPLL